MAVIYDELDGDLALLAGKQVGVIGYGNVGRPLALNLRDSGVRVAVGVRDEDHHETALTDGVPFAAIEDVVADSQVIFLLLSDEVMPQVYLRRVTPQLRRGHTLLFTSGYNVAFGFIEAPSFVDVGLVAPRVLGPSVRESYLSGRGFHSFVGVAQDASGGAWGMVLAVARAVGALRSGAIEVSIEQEAELDLFMQQAIMPLYHQMVTTAARLLLKHGYPSEAVFSDLYMSNEFTDYVRTAAQNGLMQTLQMTSLTSQYGLLSRLERFNDPKLERTLEQTLDDIRRGNFARDWSKEYSDNYPRLRKLLKQHNEAELWDYEQQSLDQLKRNDGV
jgi:ketol-acid reductoisomerase